MEDDNSVKVDKKIFMGLVLNSMAYTALHNGAVNSWEWYVESMTYGIFKDDMSFRDARLIYDYNPDRFFEEFCKQYTNGK